MEMPIKGPIMVNYDGHLNMGPISLKPLRKTPKEKLSHPSPAAANARGGPMFFYC